MSEDKEYVTIFDDAFEMGSGQPMELRYYYGVDKFQRRRYGPFFTAEDALTSMDSENLISYVAGLKAEREKLRQQLNALEHVKHWVKMCVEMGHDPE